MISCEHLSAGYGRKRIIQDITWKAEPGRLTVIIGPNGSGKSTLLKSLMGQTKILDGQIFLEKRALLQWSPRETAMRMAYVPQSRSEGNLTVARMVLHGRFPYLSYPRHYTGEDYDKVDWALEKMGIPGLKNRLIPELSGGERQKAYLAMALTQDTPVILLDEPATYLDISWQLELMEILAGLAAEGKAVVAILHDLGQSLKFADRLTVMDQGALAAFGTPDEILRDQVLEKVFGLTVGRGVGGRGEIHYWFERGAGRGKNPLYQSP